MNNDNTTTQIDKRTLLQMYLDGDSVNSYDYMGAHKYYKDGHDGVIFRVWAPNALTVSVVGDFNDWNNTENFMTKIDDRGVWECFITNVMQYQAYKYCVETPWFEKTYKTDPYGFHSQTRPDNATLYYDLNGFEWTDDEFCKTLENTDYKESPMNIYELHAGSWKRHPDGSVYSYRQLADDLLPYVKDMGYTHIEFMPLTEYPFDGSWGYQVTGYFAPTSRYGTPHDFMYLIDIAHSYGIQVILDWVPAHFPKDAHGLANFDGTACYEYFDWRKGEHKEWGTLIFNYGRYEVKSFLMSSAVFWLEKYHIDGIRVDAVASMLYLDYNRNDGEWVANQYGGKEHIEAVEFLQTLNAKIQSKYSSKYMIAEESTSWPMVTKPSQEGGLGFQFKWNMGWMNDMLKYLELDPYFRPYHHNSLTFSFFYAFSENFLLPISHDEVVYGKGSLIEKMPGSYEDKFNGVKTFIAYMMIHPGKKLTFMGSEIGQFDEWDSTSEIQWDILQYEKHQQLNYFFKEINNFYKENPPMYEIDFSWEGFSWIHHDDYKQSVIAFQRIDKSDNRIIVVCNFQPVYREGYEIGVPVNGYYAEVFNTDDTKFGGSGVTNGDYINSEGNDIHGCDQSITLNLPPMSVMYFKCVKRKPPRKKKVVIEETSESTVSDEDNQNSVTDEKE